MNSIDWHFWYIKIFIYNINIVDICVISSYAFRDALFLYIWYIFRNIFTNKNVPNLIQFKPHIK